MPRSPRKRRISLRLPRATERLLTTCYAFPLIYQGETLGELQVAPRAPGDQWTAADRHALDELARHTGAAAHAVRLKNELQRSNANLADARERLVTAREEERRHLCRDLHDGLGPALAALTLKVGAAHKLIARDRESADTLLGELSDDIQATVGDIRRLVYDLCPPTLDELGLVGAIRERAAQYSSQYSSGADSVEGLQVIVSAPDRLPALPAAVEVAVYCITQEALANVARHAHAHTCRVRLKLDGMLQLAILDDGIGLPPERRFGVGLTAMRERAVELSGTCIVDDHPLFRNGMRALLGADLETEAIGEAMTGDEAVTLAANLQPDVILMDIQIPGISGIEATRQILRASPHIRILVVTMFEDGQSVFTAMLRQCAWLCAEGRSSR